MQQAITARLKAGALVLILALLTGVVPLAGKEAAAEDRHAGYYYPKPASTEVYKARSQNLPDADRAFRVGFVTGLAAQMASRPYAPQFIVFAKGAEAQKMIITAVEDGPLDTIYRARAVLAEMTAMARTLPVFREFGVEDWFTFLDLCKMMGFEQVTVTDGRDFAHQITVE